MEISKNIRTLKTKRKVVMKTLHLPLKKVAYRSVYTIGHAINPHWIYMEI